MQAEEAIRRLGITLPSVPAPAAQFVPAKQVGNLLYISGQLPFANGELISRGKVGGKVSLEQAQIAARCCAVNLLGVLKAALGSLDKVQSIVKLQIFVSSENGFDQQHLVANAASGLLAEVFGEVGSHTRTAVGINQLAMDATVEIDAIVEVAV